MPVSRINLFAAALHPITTARLADELQGTTSTSIVDVETNVRRSPSKRIGFLRKNRFPGLIRARKPGISNNTAPYADVVPDGPLVTPANATGGVHEEPEKSITAGHKIIPGFSAVVEKGTGNMRGTAMGAALSANGRLAHSRRHMGRYALINKRLSVRSHSTPALKNFPELIAAKRA